MPSICYGARAGALAALSLLTACTQQPSIGGPCTSFGTGENPCRQQLYFPSGIAADPDGDVLYVSSANADLRFSGGTVQSIDLVRFECVLHYVRGEGIGPGCDQQTYVLNDGSGNPILDGPDQPKRVHLTDPDPRDPSHLLIDSDAAGCSRDLLDPSIVQCDETPFITSAVRVGNFAGELRVQRRRAGCHTVPEDMNTDGGVQMQPTVESSGWNRRLWLAVRGDPSITYVNVAKPWDPSLKSDPRDKIASAAHLDCEDPGNTDPAVQLDTCNSQRITERDFHQMGTSTAPSPVALPPEPFGLALDEGPTTAADPCAADAQDPTYSHLLVSHLLGGEITLINSGAFHPTSTAEEQPKEQVVLDVRGGIFNADPTTGRRGAFGLAPLHPGDPLSYWYATSRFNPYVAMFRVAEANVILPFPGFNANGGPYIQGDDMRDVVVLPDATRAFVVENHPPTLFTVDTRPATAEGSPTGLPVNTITDIVDLCAGPSHAALRQWTEPGAPGEPDRTITNVFVVCFSSNQVEVIDPDLSILTDTIQTGVGPTEIAFNFGNPGQTTEPAHRRAYVTDYTESTVAVIDLDRGSPTEHHVIGKVGVLSLPQQ